MSTNFSCGQRIRELRAERGLSQEQLALASGITPAYLGQIERGLKNPTVHTIERVCKAMKVSLAAFFAKDNPPPAEKDEAEQQVLGQLSLLTGEEKAIVVQMVKSAVQLRTLASKASK